MYGDTDSLFVLLPGRSRADAFAIGAEIAAGITAANPPPVTLKLEKAHPCLSDLCAAKLLHQTWPEARALYMLLHRKHSAACRAWFCSVKLS